MNLFVPLLFGWMATEKGGRVGMWGAVVMFWAAGRAVCQRPGRLRLALVIGSTAVGSSQVVPILHIMAGAVAIGTWEDVTGEKATFHGSGSLSEVGGFAVTFMAGQPLILAALLFGYGLCWLNGWPLPEESAEDPDEASGGA